MADRTGIARPIHFPEEPPAPKEHQIGFLSEHIPAGEISDRPLIEVAGKLVYYMDQGLSNEIIEEVRQLTGLPDGFYRRMGIGGDRGFHTCDVDGGADCEGVLMTGVFDFKRGDKVWQFPTGIVHYIVDHSWDPGEEFRNDLARVTDPPEDFKGTKWHTLAPNRAGLFCVKDTESTH